MCARRGSAERTFLRSFQTGSCITTTLPASKRFQIYSNDLQNCETTERPTARTVESPLMISENWIYDKLLSRWEGPIYRNLLFAASTIHKFHKAILRTIFMDAFRNFHIEAAVAGDF